MGACDWRVAEEGISQGEKTLLVAAGVRRARLHDARHTAATLLLAQHITARVVMEILGHSTMRSPQNVYGHVMPEAVTKATTALADVLWAPEATTLAPRRARRNVR